MAPNLHVFGLSFKSFGLLLALAFLASGVVAWKRLHEQGKPTEWAYEMIFCALVGGIVGSRVYYLVQHYDEVKNDLIGSAFSGSGLVWYGGLIGGAIGCLAWAWFRKFPLLELLDFAAVPLAIGYAIGRIGCQVSGDGDYGVASDLPWAMAYPDGAVPTDQTVHPTPIYETLAMGFVTYALWRLRDSFRPGILFALYLFLAGLERFLVEFVRRNEEVVAGLTTPQLEAIASMLIGLVWIAIVNSRGGLRRVKPIETREPAKAT